MNNKDKQITELIQGFSLEKDTPAEESDTISFCLPISKKQKFDELQRITNKRFGKKIKELILTVMDRAEGEDKAS
jgi:hypothetical protein